MNNYVKQTLNYAKKYSPFYKERLKKIDPAKITAKIWESIPVTTRDELAEKNFDFLSVPQKDLLRVYLTGGTTGKSKKIFLNKHDFESYTEQVIDFYKSIGLKKGDALLGFINHGLFPGGFVFGWEATRMMGILYFPVGTDPEPGLIKELIDNFNVVSFLAAPPMLIKVSQQIKEIGIDAKKVGIRVLQTGGTSLSDHNRKELEELWNAELYMQYGAAEVGNIGFECSEHNGYHIIEDKLFVEVLDQQTKQPVKDGKIGLISFTTLDRQAMPLVRYIGVVDLVKMNSKPCPCGRSSPRVWVVGRASDQISLPNFHKQFIYEIEWALDDLHLSRNFQVILQDGDKKESNKLTIKLEEEGKKISEKDVEIHLIKQLDDFQAALKDGSLDSLKIKFVPVGSLERTPIGKIKDRLKDERKEKKYW